MTQKDYIRLARAFANTRPEESPSVARAAWASVLIAVAGELCQDSSRFDFDQFLGACYATEA